MKTAYKISLCIMLQCGIAGAYWYKNNLLATTQKQNHQLHATHRHLLRQKTELEKTINTAYQAMEQFASDELNMKPIAKNQIRTLPDA